MPLSFQSVLGGSDPSTFDLLDVGASVRLWFRTTSSFSLAPQSSEIMLK